MFEVVDRHTGGAPGPVSGTVRKGPFVMSVQIPTLPETDTLPDGGISAQAPQIFKNLADAMEDAGGSLRDVMFVQVFITDPADWATMHDVWCDTFSAPYPGRATVVVKELMMPGMLIEIVATAHLG